MDHDDLGLSHLLAALDQVHRVEPAEGEQRRFDRVSLSLQALLLWTLLLWTLLPGLCCSGLCCCDSGPRAGAGSAGEAAGGVPLRSAAACTSIG
ncbi:MAG TPA: hypothetical protein VMT85_01690 [Thermoanaerobaculia bacterium]|nr:hypothetical protein [Thermoanaerobaculia bacterium]